MKLIRPVDWNAYPKDEFKGQVLADSSSGFDEAVFAVIRTPEGKASPAGLHTHTVDQFYYVLEGTLGIQLGKGKHEVKPHSLVYIPPGLTHSAWNAGSGAEVHIEMLCPHPPADQPRANRTDTASDAPAGVELIRSIDWSKYGQAGAGLSQNLVNRSNGVTSLSFNVFKMPPGRGIGEEGQQHFHGFTHVYYVIEGALKVRMGFQEFDIPKGSFAFIPPAMIHWTRNAGNVDSINLNIRIPEADTPHMQGSRIEIAAPEGRPPSG